eukprot:571231-Lingulodinium_polyedra.AAC.1
MAVIPRVGGRGVGGGPADVARSQRSACAAGGVGAEGPYCAWEVSVAAAAAIVPGFLLALLGVYTAPGGFRDLLGVSGGAHGGFELSRPS